MKRWLPVFIIFLFAVLSVGSALAESLTFDEVVHAQEGINAIMRHTFAIDTNNPPLIRELAMLPIVLGARLSSPVEAMQMFPARVVIILLGVVLLAAVYLTTKKYFGNTQALVAVFLLALEPTFLAHSHYVTLDTGLTLFFFLAYAAFLRLMERYSVRNLFIAGVSLGVAASSKILALPIFVVSSLIAGLSLFSKNFNKIIVSIPRMLLFAGTALIVIWATYFFAVNVIIAPREDAGRLSSRLKTYAIAHNNKVLSSTLAFLETQKVPLGDFLAVLKNSLIRSQQKQQTFFLGSFYPESRWYFMPVNLFYKEPLALWILFTLGLCAGIFLDTKKKNTLLFAIPFFVILAISSNRSIQPWVRYAEPAMPFLAIIAAQSVSLLFTKSQKAVFLLLILWYAFSVSSSFPHFITYASELAGPADARYAKFMDSNLDWGQSLPDIATYVRQTKPAHVRLSYFGRDNGDPYGLASGTAYGRYKLEDICAFHDIDLPYTGTAETVISASNWYYCGYYKKANFSRENIRQVIGGSALVFYE